MKKFLLLLTSLYLALVLLMPKVELYYTLKNLLHQEHIVLTQETLRDRWFDLKIEGLKLYYDGIESATAEEVELLPWLFFNQLEATGVKAGKDLKKMFDFVAEKIVVRHSVLQPLIASVKAEGNFGLIKGSFDLKTGKLKLLCEPNSRFKRSQAFRELFRKSEEGYIHESTIR